jgi:hypothetical protein
MPKQSHSGWTGDPFHNCDCHQKTYHVSQLRRQDGLIVCPDGFDNPQRTRTVDRRQSIITARLSNGEGEPQLAEILERSDDNTSEFA